MAENNQLHLDIIKCKEDFQAETLDMKNQIKQLQSENQDVQFLCQQKDNKIVELDRQLNEMKKKLQMALQSTQYKESSEIQKAFGRDNSA